MTSFVKDFLTMPQIKYKDKTPGLSVNLKAPHEHPVPGLKYNKVFQDSRNVFIGPECTPHEHLTQSFEHHL